MDKPKLLYLVHRIPYPPNKGDKIRSFHFLQALAAEYQVYLGAFVDDPDDKQYVEALMPFCREVCCVDLHANVAKIKSLRGLLSGEALSLPYYRNHQLQDWVDRVIRQQGIDRALIFSSPMAQYVENYPGLSLVADLVDVDSDKWRQYASSKHWPASWIYRRESEKLLTYERQIAGKAKATLLVSEQEARLLKRLVSEYADKIGFVNNGVDTERFDPDLTYQNPFDDTERAIVFTGAMDYWANVDAVKWFAEQIFPSVKRECSQARFYIVGSKPTKDVLQLAENDSAIVVTGRVEDVRPYVAHAHVVVAPLRIARGIQNKVLEAMAMAKTVVVSPSAMEGIAVSEDARIAVADTSEEYASRVVEVLQNPVVKAVENRRYVQRDFDWHHNGLKLCRLLADDAVS